MDYYQIWCNLKNPHADLEFATAVHDYLRHLEGAELLQGFRVARRKLGLGPADLGDFQIEISVRDLVQLEALFQRVAARQGETERLHAAVYSQVTDARFALYRDFPDAIRNA
jgi:hypothetical protein